MNVNWIKCQGDKWCPLENVNLSDVDEAGVYIIWYNGNPGRVVRLGQGDIAERLKAHCKDPNITRYAKNGTLLVTWAAVSSQRDRDGIERYLANGWTPLVGDAFPDVTPIAVNSPW